MKTLTFKTSINCGGCLAKVTPLLNKADGIAKWDVDTAVPQKTLTVQTESLTPDEIMAIVRIAGFNIEES